MIRSQVDIVIRRDDDDDNMLGMRGTEAERNRAHIAHGTVISVAIVLLFPIGGIDPKAIKVEVLDLGSRRLANVLNGRSHHGLCARHLAEWAP